MPCKVGFFFFFWGLSIKACQRRTHRCQGAWLTQWDCKLELHGMQQFKRTQMTSAVLGNRELSSCLVFRAAVLLAIVSRRRSRWLRKAARQRERESEAKRRFLPTDPTASNLPLFSSEAALALSWEGLTDSSLCANLLCDSYHTTETSVLCSSSPSYSEEWKYIFPQPHIDTSLPLPARLEEKWKSSKWNTQRERQSD